MVNFLFSAPLPGPLSASSRPSAVLKQEECGYEQEKGPLHPFSSSQPSLPFLPPHKGAASVPLHHKKDLPEGLGQKGLSSAEASSNTVNPYKAPGFLRSDLCGCHLHFSPFVRSFLLAFYTRLHAEISIAERAGAARSRPPAARRIVQSAGGINFSALPSFLITVRAALGSASTPSSCSCGRAYGLADSRAAARRALIPLFVLPP